MESTRNGILRLDDLVVGVVAALVSFGWLAPADPDTNGLGLLDLPARIAWVAGMAILSLLVGTLAVLIYVFAKMRLFLGVRMTAARIRTTDRWLERKSPRAAEVWRSLRSLEGYQWASLIGVGSGALWFVLYRLGSFLDGSRSATRSELDGDIAGMVGLYLLALWVWGVNQIPFEGISPIHRLSRAYAATGAAAEILPQSLLFLTSPLRWLFRAGWQAIRR